MPEQILQSRIAVPAVAEACSAAEACFASETKPVLRVTSHQIGQVTHQKADARMPAADAAAAAALSVAATSADTTGSAFGQIQQTQIGPEQLELSTSAAPAAQSHPEAAEPPAAAAASVASSAAAAAASAGTVCSAPQQNLLS